MTFSITKNFGSILFQNRIYLHTALALEKTPDISDKFMNFPLNNSGYV